MDEVESWRPPASFDDFEVIRYIGAGGMGTVYLAREEVLGRLVALKFVSQTAKDPAVHERFMLEARAIARLHHPNVVGVYRLGAVEGRPYLAYEFVDGRRLDRIARPMPWRRVLAIGIGLARGLAAAHQAGVLHRDIKPANVMLTAEDEVKLLDFGMAKFADAGPIAERWTRTIPAPEPEAEAAATPRPGRAPAPDPEPSTLVSRAESALPRDGGPLTVAGTVVGTPLYIAPELWQDAPASERSDLYALGMVLHELLVGRLPLAHLAGEALARAALVTDMPSLTELLPEVPRPLTTLLDRCVRREPADRPASAVEVRDVLEALSALYRPLLGEGGEAERDAALLTESFLRAQGPEDELAGVFYERWFAADPGVRSLFGADLVQQRRMLTAALKLAIDNLRAPERLVPLLADLGRRHAGYGVESRHFAALGRALMASIEELDPEWDPAIERAWAAAIARITQLVQGGMEAERADRSASQPALGRARIELPLVQPRTQWARDGEVAFQVVGNGPIDVLVIGEWVTHVEQLWRHRAPAEFVKNLASIARVIVFDRRGVGLSDRTPAPGLDAGLEDILAVLDAASSDQPAVLGIGDGGPLAVSLAALVPGRVRALVLLGSGDRAPIGDRLGRAQAVIRERWGGPLFVEDAAPSLASDPTYRRWWAATLRGAADRRQALRMLAAAAALDVSALSPTIHTPTLMVHREQDRIWSIAQAGRTAAAIPGAQLVALPGADHTPWAGDVDALLDPVHAFLADLPTAPVRVRMAATAVAARAAGEAGEAFAAAVRREFARHGGVPIHRPGEALEVALFDAPGRAVRCADAIAATSGGAALGVETGELAAGIELTGPVIERASALAVAGQVGEVRVGPVTRGLVAAELGDRGRG